MTKAISLPFAFDQSGSIAYTKDEKKIWQDRVVLVLMTRLGERLMRPTFGSEIGDSLFESSFSSNSFIYSMNFPSLYFSIGCCPKIRLLLEPNPDFTNFLSKR